MNELDTTLSGHLPKDVSQDRLVHMLYEAVLDNSLWPEMISELLDYVDAARANPSSSEDEARSIAAHFERAFQLSESTVALQEQNATLSAVLEGLVISVALYDSNGRLIYGNQPEAQLSISVANGDEDAPEGDGQVGRVYVPTANLGDTRLPANAAWLVLSLPKVAHEAFLDIGRSNYLTRSETRLLEALFHAENLRSACAETGFSYETGRTYLKRILSKTGCSDQAGLQRFIARNPATLVRKADDKTDADERVRHLIRTPSGGEVEYFSIGKETANAVLHFDALTGVAIDSLGASELYKSTLDRLNLRIITPARPGTFRSTFRTMRGLSEFTSDLELILDHLNIDRATILSQGFGSSSALAFAASAPDRVDRAILCAPSFASHEPADWRNMDLFYIISGVIGKRAPGLLEKIIPFLMRSVMQNTEKYLARHIKRSRCPADIEVLSSPRLHKRIPENLGERAVNGVAGLVQENYMNTHGWDFDLADVVCPVTIVQGALDNVSDPEGAQRLARLLPDADLRLFDDLGQYLIFTEWPWILELCAGRAPSMKI